MIDQRPELQRVPAASVKEIVAPGEDVLPEVRRSDIGSHRRHTADVNRPDLHARHKRVLRNDNSGRRRIHRMGPAKGEPERVEHGGGKNMVLRKRRKLAPAEAFGTELRIIDRVGFGRVVKRVPDEHAIGGRKNLVLPRLPIVVLDWLRKGKREPVIGKIRGREQIQQWLYHRKHAPARIAGRWLRDARIVRQYMARRRDRVRNGGDAEALPQSFIHSKEEALVLPDGTSDGAPKLVAGEGGQTPLGGGGLVVEKVSRVQRAVP